jgi:hypothetical protein
MSIIKKIFFFSILVYSGLTYSGISGDRTINYKQAANYVEHVINTLFVPPMHLKVQAQEIAQFIKNTKSSLLKMPKSYKTLQLCDAVLAEMVYFIEQQSIAYAHQELKNTIYTIDANRKEALIKLVSTKLRTKVKVIVDNQDIISAGALMSYIGIPLRTKVIKLLKKQNKALATD